MSANYDNWERLVAAVLRREQLWQLFHSPSLPSETESCFRSSFRLDHDFRFEISTLGDLFQPILQQPRHTVVMFPRRGGSLGIDDLIKASGELIGTGAYGISYKAVVGHDSDALFVKRLKSEDYGFSGEEFIRKMKVIAETDHENVCALWGYSCSEEEKVVLYEYYDGGSAASLLHGVGVGLVQWRTQDFNPRGTKTK